MAVMVVGAWLLDGASRALGLHENFSQKLLYFLVYGSYGVLFPYWPVFFEQLRMNKSQIGVLTMIPNFASFFVAPLLSIVSDMLDAHYEMMLFTLVVSTFFTLGMIFAESFAAMASVLVVASVFRAPLSPLIDALAINSLADKADYGKIRLWGAVGFGLLSFAGGVVSQDHSLLSFRALFYISTLFVLCGGVVIIWLVYRMVSQERSERLRRLLGWRTDATDKAEEGKGTPCYTDNDTARGDVHSALHTRGEREVEMTTIEQHSEVDHDSSDSAMIASASTPHSDSLSPPPRHDDSSTVAAATENLSVLQALYRVFAAHPSVLVFSAVVFLSGFGSGVIDSFLFVRLKQLGGSGLVMGISRFITCAAEVPMFQIAGWLQQRFGTWPVMALTQIAFVVRFTYYAALTDPWVVLPCEVLHGLTYATMWSVSCTYANAISPPECHSSMQALLEGLHWGIGSGMGALIGGFAYDRFGAVRLFEASALLSFGSLVLAGWMCLAASEESSASSTDSALSVRDRPQRTAQGGKYSTVMNDEEGEFEEIYFDTSLHTQQREHILHATK